MIKESLSILHSFNQTALNWFIPLADGTLKGTAILVILFLFLKFRRRTRPQTRHLILFIGMVSILLIPLVTQGIAALSAVRMTNGSPVILQSVNPPLTIPQEALLPAPLEIKLDVSVVSGLRNQLTHWSVWLFLIWMTGLLVAGGKWLSENLRASRLDRKGRPVHDPEWTALLDDLKAVAGITLPVTLKFSPTVPFPLVLGWIRPLILLPDSAADWTPDRRRAILLHELSHIRRYDNLSQILATAAAIVYWFNPLIWMALRYLKTSRELACDDRVLEAGVLPSVYASHLLAVIQSLRTASIKLKSVAAMAAPNLEQRMVNILAKHNSNRKSLTRHNFIGLALIAILIVVICSLGSFIGFAADNDNFGPHIQEPRVSIQGDQMELDLQGIILKGSMLDFPTLWPEKEVKHRIASFFGVRFHPIFKENRFHSGIDIASPMGTPIVAAADGEVIVAEFRGSNSYGNYIRIKHKYLTSAYAMLDRILVSPGDKVRRGDLIAYSGASGINTGPHLHYEIRYGETPINPQALAGITQ